MKSIKLVFLLNINTLRYEKFGRKVRYATELSPLLTNELYSITEHVAEQVTDQLAKARISEHHPWVFAIGSEFVTRSMEGEFNNTIIIMMDCPSLHVDDLG